MPQQEERARLTRAQQLALRQVQIPLGGTFDPNAINASIFHPLGIGTGQQATQNEQGMTYTTSNKAAATSYTASSVLK